MYFVNSFIGIDVQHDVKGLTYFNVNGKVRYY